MADGLTLHSALWAIRARPARTLSMALALGAAVACVVFTSSVLSGFSREIERLAFGNYPRTLVVRQNPLVPSRAGPPSLDDRTWLMSELPGVESSAAWIQGQAPVRGDVETRNFAVFGTVGDYRREVDAELLAGRWLGEGETATLNRVCLIGSGLADFMRGADLVGRDITLNGIRCEVVGVYDYARSRPAGRFNDAVIAPFLAARRYFILRPEDDGGPREADWLSFFMEPGADMDETRYQADRRLRRLAGVPLSRASPYSYDDPQAAVRDQLQQRDALTRLLWTVTVVALFTSLIGYGGIAFAATDARRRELALRAAMGGTSRQVLRQIVLEHVIIGALSVILGLTAGLLAVFLASVVWDWPVAPNFVGAGGAIVLGLGVGAAVGFLVARRAIAVMPAVAVRT